MNFKPFKQCRACPRLKKSGPANGYYYDYIDGKLMTVECDCHKKWVKENNLIKKYIESKVDIDLDWDSYRGKRSRSSLDKLKIISNNPENAVSQAMFYLYGPNSCQKTSMAKVLGKKLIESGKSVFFTTMNEAINNIKPDFNEKNEDRIAQKNNILDKITNCDFLIIDESFDRDKFNVARSGYEISFLDTFLRTRFETNHKSIMFISNKSPEEIESQGFGTSIQSLIERNTQYTLLRFEDNYRMNEPNPKNFWEDCEV